jgi:hypothetical protein
MSGAQQADISPASGGQSFNIKLAAHLEQGKSEKREKKER